MYVCLMHACSYDYAIFSNHLLALLRSFYLLLPSSSPLSLPYPGTTYSCVGVYKNGRVEIIANDQGNRITPSYVAWNDAGDRLVGEGAKSQATLNPEQTVFDVKCLIGRQFKDKTVQHDKKLFPFKLIERRNAHPRCFQIGFY